MSLLRWTCQSAATLAVALQAQGHAVSERTVNRRRHDVGYRLPSNRQTIEGRAHPDRAAPFQDINHRGQAFQRQGQPVVSVDTNQKALVGQFRHGGREWHPQGQPEEVNVHDFPSAALGKVIPSGVSHEATKTGWVRVGVDHDTAECAVETVRRWWRYMGSNVYPQAKRLLITADGGGSNGSRCRLWKVDLIGHTTTTTGLSIRSAVDEHSYPTGREVTEQPMESLAIKRDKFHGEWNDTLKPRTSMDNLFWRDA
jgi:hypothetical protein